MHGSPDNILDLIAVRRNCESEYEQLTSTWKYKFKESGNKLFFLYCHYLHLLQNST
jgi:hypothetical protein